MENIEKMLKWDGVQILTAVLIGTWYRDVSITINFSKMVFNGEPIYNQNIKFFFLNDRDKWLLQPELLQKTGEQVAQRAAQFILHGDPERLWTHAVCLCCRSRLPRDQLEACPNCGSPICPVCASHDVYSVTGKVMILSHMEIASDRRRIV